jgi:tetratricopeptide (TPR) repeat protein
MRKTIGRMFSSVARAEMPGFEPFADVAPAIADPLQDPERLARLRTLLHARRDALESRFQELRGRLRGEMSSDPTVPSEEDEQRMEGLMREREDLVETIQRLGKGDLSALLEFRAPSLLGLSLARALRDEGREEEARAMASGIQKDLEKSGELKRFLLVEAELEMTVGSTWSDSGDPAKAEVEISRAADRLEAIESSVKERGASPRDLAYVRGLRASALVSLAVNANVKLNDPKKALAYFEKAFELRQDEFMRVLLACYRARSGRGEEARAILREISPSPANLYNVACTWALLGEKDLALECLRRDLEENPMSEGARAKQREWAKKDPDLASVRDDPRFQAIVGE